MREKTSTTSVSTSANSPWLLSAFYLCAYAYTGVFRPFFNLWLQQERNFTLGELSLLLSLIGLIRLVSDPALAHITDKYGRHKYWLVGVLWTSFLLLVLLNFLHSVWAITLCFVLFYALRWQMFTLVEYIASQHIRKTKLGIVNIQFFLVFLLLAIFAFVWRSPLDNGVKWATAILLFGYFSYQQIKLWKMKSVEHDNPIAWLSYSHLRVWGSLSFILVLPVFYAFQKLDTGQELYYWVVPMMSVAVGLTAIVSLFLPSETDAVERKSVTQSQKKMVPFKKLVLEHKHIFIFIVMVSLLKSTTAMYNSYGAITWNNLGFSTSEIGSIYGFESLMNVLFFFLGAKFIEKKNSFSIFVICSFAMVLRWVLVALFPGQILVVMFVQALGGITYAVAHSTLMVFVAKSLPIYVASTGLALYGSLSYGLGAIYPPILTVLIENDYAFSGWWLMSSIAFLCFIGFVILRKTNKNMYS